MTAARTPRLAVLQAVDPTMPPLRWEALVCGGVRPARGRQRERPCGSVLGQVAVLGDSRLALLRRCPRCGAWNTFLVLGQAIQRIVDATCPLAAPAPADDEDAIPQSRRQNG